MALHDHINKRPILVAGFTGVAVVFGIIMIFWQLRGGTFGSPEVVPKRYFTVDDGKSYFADTFDKLPPFTTSDNKTVLRAQVMQCGGESPFVAYVEKYPDAEKARLAALFKDTKTVDLAITIVMGPEDRPLVKKASPGDTAWKDPSSGRTIRGDYPAFVSKGGITSGCVPEERRIAGFDMQSGPVVGRQSVIRRIGRVLARWHKSRSWAADVAGAIGAGGDDRVHFLLEHCERHPRRGPVPGQDVQSVPMGLLDECILDHFVGDEGVAFEVLDFRNELRTATGDNGVEDVRVRAGL